MFHKFYNILNWKNKKRPIQLFSFILVKYLESSFWMTEENLWKADYPFEMRFKRRFLKNALRFLFYNKDIKNFLKLSEKLGLKYLKR